MANSDPSPTPNPNATKFTLDVTIDESFNYTTAADAAVSAFASAVFGLGGITSVFGTNDFVTVNKDPDEDWDRLIPAVQDLITTHL